MANLHSNLRKAAVLIRSLDGESAAAMLAQLSPAEAAALRSAIRQLGEVDSDEQADVAAEFRRTYPAVGNREKSGVELELSAMDQGPPALIDAPPAPAPVAGSPGRFEFLSSAPTPALVRYLAREHAQTIAVVLAHLTGPRAAAVLGALPEELQAETIERLTALGETDPDSLTALEREMAAWMATRGEDRGTLARRRETVANILSAADPKTRRGILAKLEKHNMHLAEQLHRCVESRSSWQERAQEPPHRYESRQAADTSEIIRARLASIEKRIAKPLPAAAPAAPRLDFDALSNVDAPCLAAVLHNVDPTVLAIALAGADELLVERICQQMPKRVARLFRRQLRRIGPTRLSDVAAAQQTVARVAAAHLAERREPAIARS